LGILLILAIATIVKIYYLFYIGFALEQAYGIYTGITLLIYILSEIFFLQKSLTFFKINSVLIVIVGIATMDLYLQSSFLAIVSPLSIILIYAGLVLNVSRTVTKYESGNENKTYKGEFNSKLPRLFKSLKDKED